MVSNELREKHFQHRVQNKYQPTGMSGLSPFRGKFRFIAQFRRFQNSDDKTRYFTDVRVTCDVEGVLLIILTLFSSLTVSINKRTMTEFHVN